MKRKYSRTSILNSIERKSILLLGDFLIIFASLNLLTNHAIDKEFVSFGLKAFVFGFGISTYLILSYILDFYNLEKVARKRYILSQSAYITGVFVFLVFIFTVLTFDVSFWRIPLLSFLILTPIEIWLWRLLFSNVFRILPTVKKVLYIYDAQTKESFRENLNCINGNGVNTFHKVKLTYGIEDKNSSMDKRTFHEAIGKVDTWILNVRDYNIIDKDLEALLLESILKGKEILSYTSFYETIYEALPIRSHYHSFYELLQLKNKKIRYLQVVFSFIVNFVLSFFIGVIFFLACPIVLFFNLFFNRGPLFYVQRRIGQFGKEFKVYKFRSMIVDAEKAGAKMATKK